MPALQAVTRLRRSRSQNAITKAIAKKLAAPLILVAVCMLAVFLPTAADNAEEVLVAHTNTTRVAQSAAYTRYLNTMTLLQEEKALLEHDAWYVTKDEKTDALGNMLSVYKFCTQKWADAYTWLQGNYTDDWPLGEVPETREAVNLNPTVAMAIVVNCVRESHCLPNSLQNMELPIFLGELLELGVVSGRAWGLIQWDGGRRYNLLRFCTAIQYEPDSLEAQLYYLAYEYYASGGEYSSYIPILDAYGTLENTRENVTDAAEAFRARVERGGTAGENKKILDTWGNKWESAWGPKPEGGLYDWLIANIE